MVPRSSSLSPTPEPYKRLLSVLVEFEAKHGFADGGTVSSVNRSCEVSLWKKNARKRASCVPPNRKKKIGSKFWCWWKNAQPSWRNVSEKDLPLDTSHRGVTGEWWELDVCGANGVICFVAALGFWGVVDPGESWSLAVEDVGWVLCCIMECLDAC